MQKKPYVIGLDMGGTNSVLGVVDARGQVLARTSIKTQAFSDINDYVNALYVEAEKIIEPLGGFEQVRGIGAGVPNGNYYTGMIEGAMNLPWQSIPFAQIMSDRFGLPCKITNDANAAAMGEMTYGAARGMKNFIMITLGTGVGSGIVVDGKVVYGHDGEGDITEVKLSLGWAPWRNLSIGVAAKYYWGNIERNYTAAVTNVITGSGTYAATKGTDSYTVSNFKFQAGLQGNIILNETRIFTFGATYDLGGRLNPKKQSYVYTDNIVNDITSVPVKNRLQELELRVPHQVGAGLYYQDRTIAWGVDYNYARWGSGNDDYNEGIGLGESVVAYNDTHTIKVGFELTPRRNDVRNYLNRISYRIGARVGNYYQTFAKERINTLAITAGLGLPVKVWGASSVNIAFEYGRMAGPRSVDMSGVKVGMVTQNYYKLSVGFSLFSADTSDYWFVRQKYD